MKLKPNYKPPFSKFVKKAHKPLQLTIEDAAENICADPEIGEAKLGDLTGIRVYKFRFNHQTLLHIALHHRRRLIKNWIWSFCLLISIRLDHMRTFMMNSSGI